MFDKWNTNSRAFILFHSRTIAFWLIALVSIDRWLSSSRNFHRRQMSNLKNVQRGLFISTLLYIDLIYFTILIPLSLIIIFGLITISNIRHSQNNIQPRELIIMLFV